MKICPSQSFFDMDEKSDRRAEARRKYKREWQKRWVRENPEKAREVDRRWKEQNRDRIKENARRYKEQYPERVLAQKSRQKEWDLSHPEDVKDRYLRSKYRIGLSEYKDRLAAQGGRCALCPRNNPGISGRIYFCVDHDHKTGMVRGLLCHWCNVGLGVFGDDPARLEAAARYITSSNQGG